MFEGFHYDDVATILNNLKEQIIRISCNEISNLKKKTDLNTCPSDTANTESQSDTTKTESQNQKSDSDFETHQIECDTPMASEIVSDIIEIKNESEIKADTKPYDKTKSNVTPGNPQNPFAKKSKYFNF